MDIRGLFRFPANESLRRTGLHLSLSAKTSFYLPAFVISTPVHDVPPLDQDESPLPRVSTNVESLHGLKVSLQGEPLWLHYEPLRLLTSLCSFKVDKKTQKNKS
jgi:hypothetical protein